MHQIEPLSPRISLPSKTKIASGQVDVVLYIEANNTEINTESFKVLAMNSDLEFGGFVLYNPYGTAYVKRLGLSERR